MSGEQMNFPESWREFLEDYSFLDSKEVYTNGSKPIPVFRVEQMVENYWEKEVKQAKPNFRLEDYQENYVMHCNTEEKAKIFCDFLHDAGRTWNSGVLYNQIIFWRTYKEKTVYCFDEGMFADVECAKNSDYQVLEFDDFNWE